MPSKCKWPRRGNYRFLPVAAMASAGLVLAAILITPPVALADEERERICAEAEKRYQELFDGESGDVSVVKMYKYNFCPMDLTVTAGTTVRWINVDKRTSHSVWLKVAGIEETDRLFPEESWEHQFADSGEYPYLCGPHGKQEGMTGKVTVVP